MVADPAHYLSTEAIWRARIELNSIDVTDRLVSAVRISGEEDTDGKCSLEILPLPGPINPDDYERKPLVITFVGVRPNGLDWYEVPRFTGETQTATYDPDSGHIAIEAGHNLQGLFEDATRTEIEGWAGGDWSPHIFEESADNWRYTQDRRSTSPECIYIDPAGVLQRVPWAAKAIPDVTLTDDHRFNNTLTYTRANRRDLLSEVTMFIGFRFTRLRHREIVVSFTSDGFCSALNQGWTFPQKSMIESAANGGGWTRISAISWTDLPPPGVYCTPERGWPGGADHLCLGASWTSALRWAQTVDEEYVMRVHSPDVEAAVGRQGVPESYGIEALADSAGWEQIKAFIGAPAGAVLSPVSDDWQLDATEAEYDGRIALAAAQRVALARANTMILKRARENRVALRCVWRPDVGLDSTVRVVTPGLTAKGKVHSYEEELDPRIGRLRLSLVLAISRHGGSGIGVGVPLDSPPIPAQPPETPTPRTLGLSQYTGGLTYTPDNPDWAGWITNVTATEQLPGRELYDERFVVRMPEIEDAARNTAIVNATQDYEIEVPQDELVLSY